MNLSSRILFRVVVLLCVVNLSVFVVKAATLDEARRHYDENDFISAAEEYGTLLTLNWPKSKVGGLYDIYTECLRVSGKFDMAEAKIDTFLVLMPGDPVAETLTVRKIRIARDRGDYAKAIERANDYLAKYPTSSVYYALVQQVLADCRTGNASSTGTLETAETCYDNKDYARAALHYSIVLGKSTTGSADIFDRLTECLMISGNYVEASDNIATYLNAHPTDPINEKLLARKIQMACYTNDFTSAAQVAKDYLAQYNHLSSSGMRVQRLYIEALGNCGQHQERVDFIEKELAANPNHPRYAELRQLQADTLTTALKQTKVARLKYADSMQHSAQDSEIYESSAYRMSNILLGEAKYAVKTDPQKANDLTTESLYYIGLFVDHPNADNNSPANQLRRLTALKRLKRYGEMESEAARYLSDENIVNTNQIVAVKQILGEYADFQNVYGAAVPTEDKPALDAIKAAYYGDSYPGTHKLVTEFLANHSAHTDSGRLAQRFLVGSMAKARATKELIAFVDQALTTSPDHPMYADFRRAQADALWDMKKTSDARAKFIDAMAHTTNDTDVYDWCCFRAGSSAMTESYQPGLAAEKKDELRTIGRKYLAEYVALPSKDRIYPANVVRRMMAYNWLKQNDLMELEAAHYLGDRADYNKTVYLQIQRMLSTNRAMRKNADLTGALTSFEQLRIHENELANPNSRFSTGISMIKSADWFQGQGVPIDRVEKLRDTGRKFILGALKDENLRLTSRMDAYYFLGDWAGLQKEATKYFDSAATTDTAKRAEMLNYVGISIARQNPQQPICALTYFDQSLQEYDKDPKAVGDRGMMAAYWAIWLNQQVGDKDKAHEYLTRIQSMPDYELKARILNEYK